MPHKSLEIKGRRFGRLVVVRRVKVPGANNAMWECRCDCGNSTIGAASNIGKTKFSCGCLAKEVASALCTTHGKSKTTEYRIWNTMKSRCLLPTDQAYDRYGARGITVCKRWRSSFENFYSDMGPRPSKRHTLDRRNNKLGYSPYNCRWATWEVQQNNRSNTKFVVFNGRHLSIRAAMTAAKSTVTIARVHGRINSGWSINKALTEPSAWRSPRARVA